MVVNWEVGIRYWQTFKELFACVGVVVLIGMLMGSFVAYDQYPYNADIEVADRYEPPKEIHETGQMLAGQLMDRGPSKNVMYVGVIVNDGIPPTILVQKFSPEDAQ